MADQYDVIVVGSGAGGGNLAHRLAAGATEAASFAAMVGD